MRLSVCNTKNATNQHREEIEISNTYILKVVIANLALTLITLFVDQIFAQVILYTFLYFYCLKLANKGHVSIPIRRPTCKNTFLCIGILICAYPTAYVLNWIGTLLSGNSAVVVDYGQNPIVVLLISMAVLPAISEETAYRGLIQGAFAKQSAMYSILISALAFAVMHMNFSAMMYAFFYGCIFGFVRIVTDNMVYSVIMHLIFNAANVGLLYINEAGTEISEKKALFIIVIVAIVLLSMLACCVLMRRLYRINKVCIAKESRSAREFISKEGMIAYMICVCIALIISSLMNPEILIF